MPTSNMTVRRLAGSLLLSSLGLVSHAAQADSFPNRPINLYVAAAPGGTTDIAARMISEPLARALGTTVVVDNRPGGSGGVAAQQVGRATPDGYTLLFQYSGFQVISPLLLKNQNWDPITSFAPVANVLSAPQLLVVRSTLPYKNLAELVESDAAKKGELNYASSGVGSLQHVATELFNQMAGTKLFHIPYNGTGPALNDMLGGAVDLTMTTPPPLLPHIQNGSLTPMVVSGTQRLDSLPEVPTAAEAGYPDLDISSWFAIYAPAGTPDAVVNKLADAIEQITQTADFQDRAKALGAYPNFQGPAELGAYTKSELARWGKVIESANIEMP